MSEDPLEVTVRTQAKRIAELEKEVSKLKNALRVVTDQLPVPHLLECAVKVANSALNKDK